MEQILLASGQFVGIFSIDYLRYWLKPASYRYVSYETYGLYVLGLIATLGLFLDEIIQFSDESFPVELFYLTLLFLVALVCSILLHRQEIHICTTMLRSYKCITPLYILIKTKEILTQQLLFLVIALGVSREIGDGFYGVLCFMLLSVLIQLPILFHMKQFWHYIYGGTMLFAAVIFFYTYNSLELFWPALYVHTVIHTFFWIALAEPSETVHNWG